MKINKLGFTLVELIVVIVILAILGTIAFIALQGFSADARDTKRLTDIRNLYSKIMTENARGVELEDLLIFEKANGITINGDSSKISRQGTINFDVLKENSKLFKDPSSGGDYVFGYSQGTITKEDGEKESYTFIQLATINEKENTSRLVGNYFKYDENDSKSILTNDEKIFIENNTKPLAYEIGGELGCSEFPNYIVNIDESKTNKGTPTKINQAWQNTNKNGACYYSCAGNYTSKFCDKEEIISFGECPNEGGIFYLTNSKHGTCDTNDIILCSNTQAGTGIVLSACNAGTNVAGTGIQSYGKHYQWGRNKGFSAIGDIDLTYTLIQNGQTINKSGNDVYGFVFLTGSWSVEDVLGNWVGVNKQGPCATGYHVSSREDWIKLLNLGYSLGLWGVGYSINESSGMIEWDKTQRDNFINNTLIPLAGLRAVDDSFTSISHGENGRYWTNTISTNNIPFRVGFASTNISPGGAFYDLSMGISVRCFKD